MPQLSQLALVIQSQWLWLLLVLAAIYFIVGRGIVGKVESTVDDRDARIAADLAEAQRLQDEAEADEEAWRNRINAMRAEAQGVTASAKSEAQAGLETKLAAADVEIAARTDAAVAELDAARAEAMAEIESVTVEATQQIVERLTGTGVSKGDARTAVAGALANA
ncbi:MAG: ATPase [Novosphingobium sp.]|nr:ATPase [Novosphingobium sp.]